MESQNIEFRAAIKFLTKKGAKAKEIHRRLPVPSKQCNGTLYD